MGSADEFLIGPLNSWTPNKAAAEEVDGNGTDSDNDVVDYDGGVDADGSESEEEKEGGDDGVGIYESDDVKEDGDSGSGSEDESGHSK